MSLELIPVTTWSCKRRHCAAADALQPDPDGGRSGRPLCYSVIKATAYDQDAIDANARRYGLTPRRIADMPACLKCTTTAANLVAESRTPVC